MLKWLIRLLMVGQQTLPIKEDSPIAYEEQIRNYENSLPYNQDDWRERELWINVDDDDSDVDAARRIKEYRELVKQGMDKDKAYAALVRW